MGSSKWLIIQTFLNQKEVIHVMEEKMSNNKMLIFLYIAISFVFISCTIFAKTQTPPDQESHDSDSGDNFSVSSDRNNAQSSQAEVHPKQTTTKQESDVQELSEPSNTDSASSSSDSVLAEDNVSEHDVSEHEALPEQSIKSCNNLPLQKGYRCQEISICGGLEDGLYHENVQVCNQSTCACGSQKCQKDQICSNGHCLIEKSVW